MIHFHSSVNSSSLDWIDCHGWGICSRHWGCGSSPGFDQGISDPVIQMDFGVRCDVAKKKDRRNHRGRFSSFLSSHPRSVVRRSVGGRPRPHIFMAAPPTFRVGLAVLEASIRGGHNTNLEIRISTISPQGLTSWELETWLFWVPGIFTNRTFDDSCHPSSSDRAMSCFPD